MSAQLFASVPSSVVLFLVFCAGACAAALANFCVDAWGWNPRYRSPWRRLPESFGGVGSKIPALARAPILGWLVLARLTRSTSDRSASVVPGRESSYFWIRPFLTEILFAAFVTWGFSRECLGYPQTPALWGVRTVFFWLLLCASYIDLDDYVIPDAVTISGAILGLLFSPLGGAAAYPTGYPSAFNGELTTWSFHRFLYETAAVGRGFTQETAFDSNLASRVDLLVFEILAIIWTFWCFALLDRRFDLRFGFKKAFLIFFRRLRRSRLTPVVSLMWLVGTCALWYLTTRFWTTEQTTALLTVEGDFPRAPDFFVSSFFGMFVGTALIWSVRFIGGAALGVEAMGFGDVVFLGMIGTFIGWQGVVIVFFMAPFLGLLFGIARRFYDKAPQIPYGPFLALASALYVVKSEAIQRATQSWFDDPILLAIMGVVGFVLLGVMLVALRAIKILFRSISKGT